ncbi:unnamed protein product [Cuscuta campestris]|uniref:Uncharacterized protein n=1 Tax=Cuscuta campestris TaxID=132261 RepID=A0A484NAN5_9ASTE|nr:unnamed protein product [Cuscuta campestris]
MSICMNTSGLVWLFPFGLSAAISTGVSNELGANQSNATKLARKVVMITAFGVSLRTLWGHVSIPQA